MSHERSQLDQIMRAGRQMAWAQREDVRKSTLAGIEAAVAERAARLGAEVRCCQSNHEGALVDFIQTEAAEADGILINAAALGHYSIALRDVLVFTGLPVVDIHISNVYAREPFRHHSVIADIAMGQVSGLGWRGYVAAVEALIEILREQRPT